MSNADSRCFVCGARDWLPAGRSLRFDGAERRYDGQCSHCGLLVDADWRERGAPGHLDAALRGAHFRLDPAGPYGLDTYTLRTAATLRRRSLASLDPAQNRALLGPHGDLPAEAALADLATAETTARVALAILCRDGERELAAAKAASLASAFAEAIVVADASAAPPGERGGVRILSRPLGGDFAAQRNAAQDAAGAPWVFQLDLDETIEADILHSLDALTETAERDGALSIGFRRQNFVDGVRADVYPDIQYRLNRREVRYRGRAHERPDPDGGWRRSFIALTGDIRHDVARAHVLGRSARYEALRPGEGRLHERDALLRPYRP